MAIQVRRGLEEDLDASKAVPGEFLVSTDTKKVRVCIQPGIIKELASAEDIADAIKNGIESIEEAEENALINISDGVDKTLSVEGKAADAKITGDKVSQLSLEIDGLDNAIQSGERDIKLNWEKGSLNSDGTENNSPSALNLRLRSNFFSSNEKITLNIPSGIAISYNGYDAEKNRVNGDSWFTDTLTLGTEFAFYRLVAKKISEESIEISDVANLSANTPYKIAINIYENSPLFRKTIIGLGDSLMAGNELGNSVTWFNKLGEKYSMNYYNKGVNGTSIANVSWESESPMCKRIDTITTEISECDYFVLEGGANDRRLNLPIGEVNSADVSTFCGAIRYIIDKVRSVYPKCKILLLTNYHRFANDVNENGDSDLDFVNAMIEVARDLCVPCFDNYHNLGLSLMNENTIGWADEGVELNGSKNGHFTSVAYDWLLNRYEKELESL